MLPSTPRPPHRGLPSNPRPSSRSRADVPANGYHTDAPSSSSLRLTTRTELRTPPLPDSRRLMRDDVPTHEHDNSVSSAASSLLDRLKPDSGYTSSRTSLEDDRGKPRFLPQAQSTSSSLRHRPLTQKDNPPSIDSPGTSGVGDALWNRVANVASTLTVSVTKAWSAKITTSAGEDTPPGQESRLTRALKAYHRDKARNTSDLPTWLFEEHEIRPPVKSREVSNSSDQPTNQLPKSRGLREIYDAYQSETRIPPWPPKGDDPPPSKAADRLKALREAKRSAASSVDQRSPQETFNIGEYDAPKTVVTQRRRVGLPSGPRRL
ncbi:hypothetical protein H0H87_000054 [Tephrocybe sp. NHM501043]|nr:hypothetical protein H0H87_000054 [Tephrocybe sp. NHM501043]